MLLWSQSRLAPYKLIIIITVITFVTLLYLFPRTRRFLIVLYAFLKFHYLILCVGKERKPPLIEEPFLIRKSVSSLWENSQNPFHFIKLNFPKDLLHRLVDMGLSPRFSLIGYDIVLFSKGYKLLGRVV